MPSRHAPLTRRSFLISGCSALAAATAVALAAAETKPARPPVRVLYLEGYPRWEFRHLRNLLVRHPNIEESVVLFTAPLDAKLDDGRPAAKVPETLDAFDAFDVILVGDLDPRLLTDRQVAMIARFVDRGGGLAAMAGPRFMPAAYRNTPLAAALPVTVPEKPPAAPDDQAGFRLSRTAEGKREGCFHVLKDEAANERLLAEQIAPLFWYSRGATAKPAATVWAEHPIDLGPDGKKAPVVVAGPRGDGKAVFVGVDDTWRWRFEGEAPFDAFWLGVIDHLRRAGTARKEPRP